MERITIMSDYIKNINFKLYEFGNAVVEPYRHFIFETNQNNTSTFYYRFTTCSYTKYNIIRNTFEKLPKDMRRTDFDDVFFIGTHNNYYHMMIECLPRLWGYFSNKDETILINKKILDSFNGLYNMLNDYMNFNKIIFNNYDRPFDSRMTNQRFFIKKLKLFASTNTNSEKAFSDIKNLAVAFWQRYTQEKFRPVKPFRKIFINRTIQGPLQKRLRCANQEEIYEQLKKKDFELLDPNKVDVLTAARMCYEAKEVIGVHGAGLTNILFCQPGTKFKQLTYNNLQEHIYKNIAKILGLEYDVSYGLKKDNDDYATNEEQFYIRGEL